MRIQSVNSSSGTGTSHSHAALAGAGGEPRTAEGMGGDLVDLHAASDSELAYALNRETMQAILQGILDLHSGQPQRLEGAHFARGSLYDESHAPDWPAAESMALASRKNANSGLSAVGWLTRADGERQPFVLDVQWTRNSLPPLPQDASGGCFALPPTAGANQGLRVEYVLTTTFIHDDEGHRPLPTGHNRQDWHSGPTPLFAQFSLGNDSDILYMAARLRPTLPGIPASVHCAQRECHYFTQSDRPPESHQVDVSA